MPQCRFRREAHGSIGIHEGEDGYKIEWSADGSAPWTSLVNVTNQDVTDSDIWCVCYATQFNDNTIAPGTMRHYRIKGVDDDDESDFSDVVSATTPGLVDSDKGRFGYGAVVSEFDSLTDQQVFRIDLSGSRSYRFTISGRATRHRVIVTGPGGTEIWNEGLEANNNLIPRFTTQAAGVHQVKISHGGSPGQYTILNAGWFQFVLVPVFELGLSSLTFGPGEEPVDVKLNTYGDVDPFGLRVQPGKAYRVRVVGRENDPLFTAATPRIVRARPPSTTHVYNMGKPWVDGVTTAASSTICHQFTEPEKCEYQAFVIDLRGQTGAQQTWRIDVTPTARPRTRPYRVGTYGVELRELLPSQLAGVRMPLRGWVASQPAQHDGLKAIKVRVGFSDAVENVGRHGVRVEGGEVTSVRAVGGSASAGAGTRSAGGRNAGQDDREVVWEFEIEPDSYGDVTVALEAWRPCEETGAICTADGRVLSEGISTTVEGPDTGPPPLTASFEDMPEAHDGESAFRFRVAFSENIGISYRSVREDAFAVSGGRVTRGKRVDDRRDLFEMTVEPDGDGDVTVALPAGRECSVSGAICTKGENRRQLTNAPAAKVAGPAVETGPAGLTARFVDMPAEHRGEGGFRFRVAFSENIGISYRSLREDAFAVSGGRVTGGKRVDGRRDLFEMTVRPDSLADVTIALPAGRACAVSGAICTKGENRRKLTNTPTATVRGPAAVSVADARAREGEDETIDFAVSLSRAASGQVSVTWATADGTATAGEDYTRTSGKLRFAAGETEKTIAVPVLDDAIDEGEETFTLRLLKASGARIADGVATGTIDNSDPLQKMWLSRFGRTVAGQLVDAVTVRLSGPSGGSQVTLGGQSIDFSSLSAETGDARRTLAGALDASSDDDPLAGLDAWVRAQDPSAGNAERGYGSGRGMTGRELLLGSSFHLVAGGGEAGGPGYAAWGRMAVGGFDAEAPADGGTVRLDGEVTTGILGADAQWERWLAGLALSVSAGEGSFDQPGVDSGTVESTLTSVSPYVRYEANDRLSAWGLLGYGIGDMTMTQAARGERGETVTRTDLSMRLGAAGARGVLLQAGETGGINLALRGDAFLVQMESEKAANTVATKADASRMRLVLEAGRSFALGEGAVLTPGLELGLRHDGGDAETGTGVEVGGRISYADAGSGLTVEANARTLVAHEDSGYREWGVGGSVRLDPGASGRGLSLTLASVWGTPSSGVERLWSARDAAGLAPSGDFEATRRLNAELGYGLGAPRGLGLVTPYAGLSLADGGGRAWRTGARWQVAPDVTLGLEGTRNEAANDNDPPQHGLMLRGAIRW